MKQLIMTLALLVTAAGAWASEKPIGLNVEYAVGDKITSTSDVYINIWWDNNDDRYGIMVTSTHSLTIESIHPTGIKLIESSNVLDLKNNGAQALYENSTWLTENIFYPSIAASAPTKVHVASGSGTLADPYVFEPGASGPAVSQVAGKSDEWEMTMPGANVLLTVAYKDRTAMALKYGEQAITDEANAVTAYKGFEKEFADALNLDAAVKNIEPALSGGDAVAVTTTAADYIFESSDGNKIGFKTATKGIYDLTGTLDQMEFRDLTENSPVTLTVIYKGTADLESSMAFLRVTIEKKTYTVSLADNTEDADSWKGNVNDAETDVNLPITKLEGGEKVTLKYNGRLKVKSVTATTDAEPDPLTVPLTMEATAAGTIVVSNPKALTFKYSTDDGATKTETSATNVEIPVEAGDKVQFYGNNTTYSNGPNFFNIKGSGSSFTCNVYGNIMSLLDEDNFATMTNLPNEEFVFYGLFCDNSTLIDASGLLLPAMTMTRFCYAGMFNNCVRLTAAPNLPAETLAVNCYDSMFFACYSLTTSPVLPAKTLVESCYYYMFKGCNVLVSVTCLATSGIKENSSTSAWLVDAGRTAEGPKTFIADPSASWPSGNSGIPSGWTRLNPDGTEYVAP